VWSSWGDGVDEAKALGRRVRELRCWRGLTLREAAGLAGLSFSFWGQVERGEKPVAKRTTLEVMVGALRVHPAELAGWPWTPADPVGADARSGLVAMETALGRFELGTDPGVSVRIWPQIQTDLDRLVAITHASSDHVAMAELASVLLGELHGGYVRIPQQRRAVLVALMTTYTSVLWAAQRLGDRGLPIVAAHAVQRCAEALEDPVWLGYAAWLRGNATGRLDRTAQYQRSVAASAFGAPASPLRSVSTARPCRPPRRCTRSCCPIAARPSSGLSSAGPWSRRRRPGTRRCACWCTPSRWCRSGSATTCSSAKRSRACCANPGAMLGAVSCAVWLGGWDSRWLGDTGRMQGEDPIARFSNSASQPRG
jgi:transcriptional regulator with XRE-family HTH domain